MSNQAQTFREKVLKLKQGENVYQMKWLSYLSDFIGVTLRQAWLLCAALLKTLSSFVLSDLQH